MPPLIIVTQDGCLTRLPFRIGFFIRTLSRRFLPLTPDLDDRYQALSS